MIRPIDANVFNNHVALYMAENAYLNDTALDVLKKISKWLEEEPTLDYAPVRHGEWNDGYCSVCGEEATYTETAEEVYDYDWEENLRYSHTELHRTYNESPYCPNCSAKMDGGKDDG